MTAAHPAHAADAHRLVLGNADLRLDCDLRTSDTMYNYLWLRNPRTGAFERLYNFGCDVAARERGGTGEWKNTIGVRLRAERDVDGRPGILRLRYPAPLVIYRQFEKAASPAAIHHYPDLPLDPPPPTLRVADGAVAVDYALCGDAAAFTTSGTHLGGPVDSLCAIVNAMWVDNPHVPTRMEIDGVGGFAWDREQAVECATISDARYALFWDPTGRGVPFAVIPHGRQSLPVWPHTNPDGEGCFQACSRNQAFHPVRAPTTGFNDVNCRLAFRESRRTDELRWAFFPECGWGLGGEGDALLARLRALVVEKHCGWWKDMTRQPRVELALRTHVDPRRPPATLWR